MRQEFNRLVEKLSSDALTAVSIFDNENFEQILKPTYGTQLKETYGSVREYFEKLNSDGKKNLTMQEYRKNGSSMSKKGSPFQVNFSEKQQSQMSSNGSFGLNGGFGLGLPDIMNLHTDSVLKAKLEARNEILEAKCQELEDKNRELKEQILQNKFSSDKASGNKEMVNELIKNLSPVITMFMQNKSGASLNAPAQNLSIEKQQLVSIISNPEFSNETVQFLFEILQALSTQEDFYEKIEQILNNNSNA